MKNIKKYIIGIAASICLTQCDVLDVDPTGWYSENVAYSSLENVDLYVKGLYSVPSALTALTGIDAAKKESSTAFIRP